MQMCRIISTLKKVVLDRTMQTVFLLAPKHYLVDPKNHVVLRRCFRRSYPTIMFYQQRQQCCVVRCKLWLSANTAETPKQSGNPMIRFSHRQQHGNAGTSDISLFCIPMSVQRPSSLSFLRGKGCFHQPLFYQFAQLAMRSSFNPNTSLYSLDPVANCLQRQSTKRRSIISEYPVVCSVALSAFVDTLLLQQLLQ